MKRIVVFCGSSIGFNTIYKQAARTLGNYFVKHNIGLVYGGAKIGLMGTVADAMITHKGAVIGVIPELLKKEEVLHTEVEEMIVCKNMSKRKRIMSKLADGYIALPGGFGTLDELFEVLTINQLHIEQKPIGILNIDGFFDPALLQIDRMVTEGFIKQENKKLLIIGNTVEELMQKMNHYKAPKIDHIINKIVH